MTYRQGLKYNKRYNDERSCFITKGSGRKKSIRKLNKLKKSNSNKIRKLLPKFSTISPIEELKTEESKKRPFYDWNLETHSWEKIEIVPKFDINNGVLPMSILITKKNPHNINSYSTLDEKDNVKSITNGQNEDDTFSMKKRLKDGLTANTEALKMCPITGTLWGGHNRLDGGEECNAKEMKVEYAEHIFNENIPKSVVIKTLQAYNVSGKRDEYSNSSILKKFKSLKLEKEKETNEPFNSKSKIHNKSYREFVNTHNTNYREINILLSIDTITSDKIKKDLLKDIDDLSFNEISKIVKNNNKKIDIIYNPDRFNFINFVKNQPKLINDIRSFFAKDILNMLNSFIYYDKILKKDINRLTDKKYGCETNAITTMLSHLCMSTACTAFRYSKLECITAAAAPFTADIHFTNLTKLARAKNENFDIEKMEIKGANFNTSLSDTKVYGGPGFALINPHEYIITVFNANYSKIFMMITTLTKEDVKRESKNCVMTLSDWFKNHYEKKDFHFIAGKIYKGNKKPEIEWEDVKDLLNPKTDKEVI